MFHKASIFRQSMRWASTKTAGKSDKIPVQLLQDCLPLGVTGQIVRVKPAYMRNFLHVGNKACYLLKDQEPRIPVVEKSRAPTVVVKKVSVEKKPVQEETVPVLSLDDLSNLFTNSRAARATEASPSQGFTAQAATSSYSLAELGDSLPTTFTINSPAFPITKDFLATTIFNSTGIEIPSSAIMVKNEKGENVVEIETPGRYSWVFSVSGQTGTLQRNLNIQ
ncbi:hypothetical protein JCM33374_g3892 [Metschnikowia sp. JCM 33374]|nr:hypothetical protein JCM33374_g3892 [Metschnikowia sp. JCM 33374]